MPSSAAVRNVCKAPCGHTCTISTRSAILFNLRATISSCSTLARRRPKSLYGSRTRPRASVGCGFTPSDAGLAERPWKEDDIGTSGVDAIHLLPGGVGDTVGTELQRKAVENSHWFRTHSRMQLPPRGESIGLAGSGGRWHVETARRDCLR